MHEETRPIAVPAAWLLAPALLLAILVIAQPFAVNVIGVMVLGAAHVLCALRYLAGRVSLAAGAQLGRQLAIFVMVMALVRAVTTLDAGLGHHLELLGSMAVIGFACWLGLHGRLRYLAVGLVAAATALSLIELPWYWHLLAHGHNLVPLIFLWDWARRRDRSLESNQPQPRSADGWGGAGREQPGSLISAGDAARVFLTWFVNNLSRLGRTSKLVCLPARSSAPRRLRADTAQAHPRTSLGPGLKFALVNLIWALGIPVLILAGVADRFINEVSPDFVTRLADPAYVLASTAQPHSSPEMAVRFLVVFTYLQTMHYVVWMVFFQVVGRREIGDLGQRLPVVQGWRFWALALAVSVLVWLVYASNYYLGRQVYGILGAFNVYLEQPVAVWLLLTMLPSHWTTDLVGRLGRS
ncbi:hypothetical protein [Propionimicrobium sp. PCR01-08-3]|uniref:hypothetical protein n=1 Tax=Propionimicrobium sp. PCR01-08-3 TaxID=3052086 RepID=UPI00255D1207|nr:hypothetical protein [Propionimicrobium sp. PCR01-08-3]WIY83911.1 hypothetical protein QQ658_06095 [Propionimicrobium sp. PCR01-08-3]